MKDNDQKPGNLGHDLLIKSSWQRCDSYGLEQDASPADFALPRGEVSHLKDKHHYLIDTTGHEVLPFYENILNNSSCLIILADREGQVLNCWVITVLSIQKNAPTFAMATAGWNATTVPTPSAPPSKPARRFRCSGMSTS